MKKILIILIFLLDLEAAHAQEVLISEIMANPEGKDKSREWIELYNYSDQTIKLDGWQLENKKTQIINGTIPAKSYIVLENLKITLKNKADHLKLLADNGLLIDEVEYQNAKTGLSFSRIEIDGGNVKNFWEWVEPSKNSSNPTIYTIDINSPELPFNYFNKKNAELLKFITSKNRPLKLLLEKSQDSLKVHDVKIENPLTAKFSIRPEIWIYYFLIASLWLMAVIRAIPLYASPHK